MGYSITLPALNVELLCLHITDISEGSVSRERYLALTQQRTLKPGDHESEVRSAREVFIRLCTKPLSRPYPCSKFMSVATGHFKDPDKKLADLSETSHQLNNPQSPLTKHV
ncbi:Uncharacterized protein HZ326_13254 [Fusarium oxysporum f. sp. albedinis]|nr:Uncharacterized protein HZ326_13254 [Fusarium oxysporum f. sp. albedinis]